MLSDVDVHYLSAILSAILEYDALEVIVGDPVEDIEAGKPRDVDVTFRYATSDSRVGVLMGMEVKHHSRKLDVTHVEQLMKKMEDMPKIDERAIVSSTGFTEPAVRKALRGGVKLYHLVDWPDPNEGFEHIRFDENYHAKSNLFSWENDLEVAIVVPDEYQVELSLVSRLHDDGKYSFKTLKDLVDAVVAEAAKSIGSALTPDRLPALPCSLGTTVFVDDAPSLLMSDGKLVRLAEFRVSGILAVKSTTVSSHFKALVDVETNAPVAACAISISAGGHIVGIGFAKSHRNISSVFISKEARARKKITKDVLRTSGFQAGIPIRGIDMTPPA